MSAISGIGSSSDASYAVQLAQSSKLGRNLNSLDESIQKGDMAAAGAMIATLIQQNPQFALPATGSTGSQDPINTGFNTLSQAVSANQPSAAKAAWDQVKSDLAKSGIVINDGAANTKKLLADAKKALDSAILNSISPGSGSGDTLSSLIGSSSTDSTDSINTMVSNWLTYKANGTSTTPPIASVASQSVSAAFAATDNSVSTTQVATAAAADAASGNLNVTA